MKRLLFSLLIATIFIYGKSNPGEIIANILSKFENEPKKELFKVYHLLFKKEYELNSEEGLRRYGIFKDNINFINDVNSKQSSFKLGINRFADMTNEEYREKMLAKMKQRKLREVIFEKEADNDNENDNDISQTLTIDWRSYLLEPRNQGSCESSWAFATAGVLESGWAIKTGVKAYLSPQQLIDCDTKYNFGCIGGNPGFSLTYTKTWGLCKETDYPYIEYQDQCRVQTKCNTVNSNGFDYCSLYDFGFSLPAKPCTLNSWIGLLAKGPIVVNIDASSKVFQFYLSGIIEDVICDEENHSLVAIGWTPDQVITLRNSWGSDWGENGNLRIRYLPNNENTCFVTSIALLPLF